MSSGTRVYAVYIVTNRRHGTLYVGMTGDLKVRIYQHREGVVDGFSRRYAMKQLVWYELHATAEAVIIREKRIKSWKREWKIQLIEEMNSERADLFTRL
ncbi:MAG: GIY-YIG nuclease family protein [Planctomycetota bacterium]